MLCFLVYLESDIFLCEKCVFIKKIFDSLSVCSSIISFGITVLLYYKIKTFFSPNEKVERMIKSMRTDNKFFNSGLNMEIDVSSQPSQKIKEIIELFSQYNNCVNKITSDTDEKIKWEYKHIGLPNIKNKLNLLMLALEIQILELEIQNKKIPIDSDIAMISEKINQFVLLARETGYID